MSILTGTAGADLLRGTAADDQISGLGGDDALIGLGGADTLDGGAGNDRFIWNPGDGFDKVEGGVGADTEFMTGEGLSLFADAGHVTVWNGSERVDLHGVEALNLHGTTTEADFVLNNLSTTDVRQVAIGLSSQPGVDSVLIFGAETNDVYEVQVLSGATLRVFDTANGVLETTVISNLDSTDKVSLGGGPGNDVITVETPAGVASPATIRLVGQEGDDTITGSLGREELLGAEGDDVIRGGGGDDIIDAGPGHDTIDGGAGFDTQRIGDGFGSTFVSVSGASGGHLSEIIFDVGTHTTGEVDAVNLEQIDILGSSFRSNFVGLGDFEDSTVRFVDVDLQLGATKDFLSVAGTRGPDSVVIGQLSGFGQVGISGGTNFAGVIVHNVDTTDRIEIDTGTGDDTINLTFLNPGTGLVIVDGGGGNDHMVAGLGDIEFIFNAGLAFDHDVIDNFKGASPSVHHTIGIENLSDRSLSEMIANHHIFQSGADVVLTGSGGSILTLTQTSLGTLTNSDFLFLG